MFWEDDGQLVEEILSIKLLCLLGLYLEEQRIKPREKMFMNMSSLQAKKDNSLVVENCGKPAMAGWFRELISC